VRVWEYESMSVWENEGMWEREREREREWVSEWVSEWNICKRSKNKKEHKFANEKRMLYSINMNKMKQIHTNSFSGVEMSPFCKKVCRFWIMCGETRGREKKLIFSGCGLIFFSCVTLL
jgi:hypothetical protein